MTTSEIKAKLKTAGLPEWAMGDTHDSDGTVGIHVHYEELETYADNAKAAKIIKGLKPQSTDKGLAFMAAA